MGLEIKHLYKSYFDKVIFNDFSYKFPSNGIFVISGESGVGKTTLLRLISGLDTDFKGEIKDGGLINCSFAFQEYRLFPNLTALENLILANYDKKDEKNTSLAKDLLFSMGFNDTDINLYPSELSGGMKQRVSLARAFMKNTPNLLLDEPTKELDEENIIKVLNIIKTQGQNRLVLIVTHNMSDAKYLDAQIIKL